MFLLFAMAPDHTGFGELDDLAVVKTPVSGDHEGNDTGERKQIDVGAAKHLHAENDGGNG